MDVFDIFEDQIILRLLAQCNEENAESLTEIIFIIVNLHFTR